MRGPRVMPPKYFYDQQGLHLFDAITRTQDYYPTRTETAILNNHKQAISALIARRCLLIEPGAGNCSKARILIEALRLVAYVLIDICEDYLQMSAQRMAGDYLWLCVQAVCGDFSLKLSLPAKLSQQTHLVFFPGSSIGNFHFRQAVQCLQTIADLADFRLDKVWLDEQKLFSIHLYSVKQQQA